MRDTVLKILILGVPFGFSLMWFTYWVVRLYKGRKRCEEQRREKLRLEKGTAGEATGDRRRSRTA